jgi:hypothetical protein
VVERSRRSGRKLCRIYRYQVLLVVVLLDIKEGFAEGEKQWTVNSIFKRMQHKNYRSYAIIQKLQVNHIAVNYF